MHLRQQRDPEFSKQSEFLMTHKTIFREQFTISRTTELTLEHSNNQQNILFQSQKSSICHLKWCLVFKGRMKKFYEGGFSLPSSVSIHAYYRENEIRLHRYILYTIYNMWVYTHIYYASIKYTYSNYTYMHCIIVYIMYIITMHKWWRRPFRQAGVRRSWRSLCQYRLLTNETTMMNEQNWILIERERSCAGRLEKQS